MITITDHPKRIMASAVTTIVIYIAMIIILKPLFITPTTGMMAMMSYANPNYITLNIVSLLIGLCAGLAIFTITKPKEKVKENIELKIIKKALSADENAAIDEIEKAGEITQDSLRFRLGWSKAKASTILTNLDKMSLIQRERQGKTYNIFLQKKTH